MQVMEPEVEGMGRVKSGDVVVDMVMVVVQWERVVACYSVVTVYVCDMKRGW